MELNDGLSGNYRCVKLEDLCSKITDGTHSTPQYMLEGVPFISVKDISRGKIDFSNVRFISKEAHSELFKRCNPELNDLLYTKVGTTGIAKVVDVDKEFSLFVSVALLKPKKELVDSYFFEYMLNSPNAYKQAQERTRGVTNKNLVLRDIKAIKIPLPALHEQTRIVAKLDALFERIDKAIALLEENIRKTGELMEAVLGEVFGELETNHPFKNFGDLVKNLDGKRIPIKSSQRQTENGTYPYYGASGIIDYVDDFIFEGENLLISEDGANLVVRKYPIAFLATGKYWVNNHAHIVCAKPQVTSNRFLASYFAFKDISGFITGSAQPKLSQQKLNVIPLAIPSLERQEKILAYLEKVKENQDALQKAQIQKLQSLKSLKSSLLDQAFSGEL